MKARKKGFQDQILYNHKIKASFFKNYILIKINYKLNGIIYVPK